MSTTRDEREQSPAYVEDPELAHLYDRIARILAIGFWTSIAVMVLGVVVAVAQGDDLGDETLEMADVLPSVLDFEAQGLIDLGILLLLLTPLAYVVAALITFLHRHDRLFVGICALLILLFAVTIGLALR